MPSQTVAPDASSSVGEFVTPLPSIRSLTRSAVAHRAAATRITTSVMAMRWSDSACLRTVTGSVASSTISSTASIAGSTLGTRIAPPCGNQRRSPMLMPMNTTSVAAGHSRGGPLGAGGGWGPPAGG